MADMEKAKKIYETVCSALDNMKWAYDKNDEELAITTGAKGPGNENRFPVDLLIRVLPEAQVISVQAPFVYDVPDEHSIDVAIAVSIANYGLIRGGFDFDLTTGDIRFRVTAPYNGSEIAEELVRSLILVAVTTTDEYQTKLFMVAKGAVAPSEFLTEEMGADADASDDGEEVPAQKSADEKESSEVEENAGDDESEAAESEVSAEEATTAEKGEE
jgi:hypothetical protein